MPVSVRNMQRVAVALAAAVFVIFAASGVLKTLPQEQHGCGHLPCATDSSIAFCVSHCLAAAQAGDGLPGGAIVSVLAAFTAVAAVAVVVRTPAVGAAPASASADLSPPLRALRTVFLRE